MAITGTLEDREEVRALHARYCLTIDAGRYDEWIDCFTEAAATVGAVAIAELRHASVRTILGHH